MYDCNRVCSGVLLVLEETLVVSITCGRLVVVRYGLLFVDLSLASTTRIVVVAIIVTTGAAIFLVIEVSVMRHDTLVSLTISFVLRVHLVDGSVELQLGVVVGGLLFFSCVVKITLG